MVSITNIGQYEALVSEANARGMRRTNNPLTLSSLSQYCASGRLFYEWTEGALLLHCNEVCYFVIYYYSADDRPFKIPTYPMTMVVRVLGLSGRENISSIEALSFEQSGFVFRDCPIQMRGSLADIALFSKEEISESVAKRGYTITDCPYEKRDDFETVRNESLEFFHAAYIDEEEWLERVRMHNFLCLIDSNGKICAVCQTRCDGRTALLQQLAVSPRLRGTGLGGALFSFFLAWSRTNGVQSVFLWVEEKNHGAIRFYERIGFHLTPKKTMEFVRKPKI